MTTTTTLAATAAGAAVTTTTADAAAATTTTGASVSATIVNEETAEMPAAFVIYHKGVPLQLNWTTTTTAAAATTTTLVKRICAIELLATKAATIEFILLITTDHNLYSGILPDTAAGILHVAWECANVLDVDYCHRTQQLFMVNLQGEVLMQQLNGFALSKDWRTLAFDPLELCETGVKINSVCCSAEGALFHCNTGETYALGRCGEVFTNNNNNNNSNNNNNDIYSLPKQIRLYDQNKMQLLQMAAGDDFFVLLLQAINRHEQELAVDCCSLDHDNQSNSSIQTHVEVLLQLLKFGHSLVHTQLHTFGAVNNGLLGIGDHMRRNNVQHLSKLDGLGVRHISAAKEHALALLQDGRVFEWGRGELSTPTERKLGRGILAAGCLQTDCLVIKTDDKQLNSLLALPASLPAALLLTSGAFSVRNSCLHACLAQTELRDTLNTWQTLLKQLLMQRVALTALQRYLLQHTPAHGLLNLCRQFEQLLFLHAALLSSTLDWCMNQSTDLLLLQHTDNCLRLFRHYTRTYCNLLAWNQFESQLSAFQAQQTQQLFLDMRLLQFLPHTLHVAYVRLLQLLPQSTMDCVAKWRSFAAYHKTQVQLADRTLQFWQLKERHAKLSRLNEQLDRRVLLSSYEVPLKLAQHGSSLLGGSQCIFVLCNDALYQLSGANLQRYELKTIWLRDKSLTSFAVVTPEQTLLLNAREPEEKQRWWQELQQLLQTELSAGTQQLSSNTRLLSYKYSAQHALYAQVLAVGQWRDGLMHGNCHLEFPAGKFYCGQMRQGQIEGYGKMLIPGVGLYEGGFKAGKFHGHGVYEMRDNEVYEGYFRKGLFHGHGLLRSNYYTYVGEYQANMRCGYGIYDDTNTGHKYMGMFADNKRNGAGTCITMTGDYFEGIYMNNEIMGCGIAIFDNENYYEGELTMHGPCGKGTYCMPTGTPLEQSNAEQEIEDCSKCMRMGNILSGQLYGDWQDMRVVSGSMSAKRQFPKYPKSFGSVVVDNNRKWRALFEDFIDELFGNETANVLNTIFMTNATTRNTNAQTNSTTTTFCSEQQTQRLWSRIMLYMRRRRAREKALEMQSIDMTIKLMQQQPMQATQQQQTTNALNDSYFTRNIVFSFNRNEKKTKKQATAYYKCNSKCNNADVNSLAGELLSLDLDTEQDNGILERRSRSQETLNDADLEQDWDLEHGLNTARMHVDSQQQQQQQQHVQSQQQSFSSTSSNTLQTQLSSFANDSAISLRSSIGSLLNMSSNENGAQSGASSTNSSLADAPASLPPNYGMQAPLTHAHLQSIKQYLETAFKDAQHPLYALNQRITSLFYTAYGVWRVKPTPLLTEQAMREWQSISRRVYAIVRCMFPALPEDYCVLEQTREVVSHVTLLYPIMLSDVIYSTLFVLYANKYSRKDELYMQNLLRAERMNDAELAQLLHLETSLLPLIQHEHFALAIQTLKQLRKKYSPKAMLTVIECCMQQITETQQLVENETGSALLSADSMMPLTLYLVLRAAVPHLGAELALLDDLTGGSSFQFEMNGLAGYCYTTLKAAYEHITNEGLGRAQ